MGNHIKKHIELEGRKNTWLASKLGCHRTEISQWISGRRKPNRERLRMLAQILKCRMTDLIDDIQFESSYNIKNTKKEGN